MMMPELDGHDPWTVVALHALRVRIIVVGAGGTGSRLVPLLAQHVWDGNRDPANGQRKASLLIVDHDRVEEKNVRARQNFCPPEIGFPKAQVLANRYALSFAMHGEEISARVAPFSAALVQSLREELVLLIGCVDNASARAEMARCLEFNHGPVPHIWYIDAGNGFHWGQIFVGNTATMQELKGCLSERICAKLPSPALLAPSMFVVPKEERATSRTVTLSCGDLVLSSQEGNRQSRAINTHMAALVYAYVDMLMTGSITTLATYTNLADFDTHSVALTPASLALALGKPPTFADFFTTVPSGDEEDEEDELAEDAFTEAELDEMAL